MRDLDECQPYVAHLRAEHRRVHEMLHEVMALMPTSDLEVPADVCLAQLGERLAALREDLAHHFAEEDEGGCIEEAVSRCPSLSHFVSELEGQHPDLLGRLNEVIAEVKAATTFESLGEIRQKFTEFAKQLKAHEATENRVLQYAFCTSVDLEYDA